MFAANHLYDIAKPPLFFSTSSPSLSSGPGMLAPPAAARQPLRAALGEALAPPCQESWFLFKLHKGSCFNQKVCLRNFMSLFHDCGWEKLGARVVFLLLERCCISQRTKTHCCQGRLPAVRPPPALLLHPLQLSTLPEVAGATSWDGF